MNTTTLHVYKQNFKFSSAHFLIFNKTEAERLHGHNYQVQLQMVFVNGDVGLQEKGFCIDFTEIKKWLKARLDQWDEVVLLPAKHPDFIFKRNSPSLEVHFRDRFYVFPENEVILLDIVNTSVELLAQIIAKEALEQFKSCGAKSVEVRVEETAGQGASYLASL